MKKIHILYSRFYDVEGSNLTIGGVQTYIQNLSKILIENDYTPIIYQYANKSFKKNHNGIEVHGVKLKEKWSLKKKNKNLLKYVELNMENPLELVIFATETLIVKNKLNNTLTIQHGIYWDTPNLLNSGNFINELVVFYKAYRAYKRIRSFRYVKYIISVDHNFINWYRSQVGYIHNNIKVITNSVPVSQIDNTQRTNKEIKIIFARRFVEIRGVYVYANVVERLLENHPTVEFTFAGEGPLEEYLKNKFKHNKRVRFIKYLSEDSLKVHLKHDIAVIPTIGSEGTSLSLLEAMSAKCAVVATNVGGMTNIVLDEFNGLLVPPCEDEIYKAVESLIINNKRKQISENGYNTVKQSFNLTKWRKDWLDVIKNININKKI